MLSAAAISMQGELHGADARFAGISTDTRTLKTGELFFALCGANFDGRDFVGRARQIGAAGAVVADVVDEALPQIAVADTRHALGRLAAAWRAEQPATVVGITGSNGKTTLKELVAACLSRAGKTLATEGNLNNEIGLPLMLTRLERGHEYAVLEMGANHADEIAYLTSLARPDIVVITNAGAAHLEGFGSLEGVARAKGEILDGQPRPDVAVLNADDCYYAYWLSRVEDVRVLSFGLDNAADVRATGIETSVTATVFDLQLPTAVARVKLLLAGEHNVRNACAAAAVAAALDIDIDTIVAGLQAVRPVAGRLQPLAGIHGATVYDDSYNANPTSVLAAAQFMESLEGEKWLVLGDMFELGTDAELLHRQTGESLRSHGIDRLFGLGALSRETVGAFGSGGAWYASVEELADALAESLTAEVNVLVKGSRGMRMERIVSALQAPRQKQQEA